MISRIDHVSVAVKDPDKAFLFFQKILGAVPGASSIDNRLRYRWQIFSMGDLSRLEILSPTEKGGFLDGFLEKKDGGVHHITLQTPDIRAAVQQLDKHGIPYFGYNEYTDAYWKEIFIHPKDAFGVLIQISEFHADDWLARSQKFPEGRRWSVEKNKDGCTLYISPPGGGKAKIELTTIEALRLADDLRKINML
jgi:methylmalonyl-CoA/ethylmalonyl-CoA epimerase